MTSGSVSGMGAPELGGALVLAADDPAALARFYAALLAVDAQAGLGPGHWRVPWPAGGALEIYAPSRRRPQPRQAGRLALCLRRSGGAEDPMGVLLSWLEAARALGASVADAPRRESFGVEAWLLDPEGNRLLLLVAGGPQGG